MIIDASVTIDSPVEEVWNFMTDWSNFSRMNPKILEAKRMSTGNLEVGTVVEMRLRDRTELVRVVEYEPYRKLTLGHASGPLKGTRSTFGVCDAEGKTRLTATSNMKLGGIYRLIAPFFSGRARREVDSELGNVKRALESEGRPS